MSAGEQLTLWTIRLSLLCYAVTLGSSVIAPGRSRWDKVARRLWTAGCVLAIAHVAAAFHYHHDWQHSAAVGHTAQRTKEIVGWAFGGGVYFNYVFVVVWLVDVMWWWISPDTRGTRHRSVAVSLHAYLLFIIINGSILFETGPTRWWAIAFGLVIGGTAIWRWRAVAA